MKRPASPNGRAVILGIAVTAVILAALAVVAAGLPG